MNARSIGGGAPTPHADAGTVMYRALLEEAIEKRRAARGGCRAQRAFATGSQRLPLLPPLLGPPPLLEPLLPPVAPPLVPPPAAPPLLPGEDDGLVALLPLVPDEPLPSRWQAATLRPIKVASTTTVQVERLRITTLLIYG